MTWRRIHDFVLHVHRRSPTAGHRLIFLNGRSRAAMPWINIDEGLQMKSFQYKSLIAASSVAALLALGGCNPAGDRTASDRMDSATSKTRQASADAKRDAGNATESAADSTRQMGA